jgi:hypothetical protein
MSELLFGRRGRNRPAGRRARRTNLLQIGDTSLSAKVPFVQFTFIGEESDRAKLQEYNPICGCIDADMVTDGKESRPDGAGRRAARRRHHR